MTRNIAALAAFVTALAAVALWPAVAEAHGGVTEFRKERAGPYEVAFGTSPRSPSPGAVHVSLRIVDSATGVAVPGAAVAMSGRVLNEDGSVLESFQDVPATPFEEDPVFWDIDLAVVTVGDWVFSISVEGEEGAGEADFDVRVQESSPVTGIITVIVLVAFLSVVALAMRTYFGARKTKRVY
jgi:hypothetical protein